MLVVETKLSNQDAALQSQVVVYTLGCKVNQYESDAIVQEFLHAGIDASTKMISAEVYIINSCSVTSEACKKSRQICRKAKRLNPNATVFVCGCAVQEYEGSHFGGAKIIAGAQDKDKIVQYILAHHTFASLTSPKKSSQDRARKHIKIQDGCDEFCSYCIIPHLRGTSRSRSIEDIVQEISHTNANELILTGINITSYGKDIGTSLTDLIQAINTTARIRLSSIGCLGINVQLLRAMQANNCCSHFHLSLQSGSNSVLKAMNRKYTTAEFADKVSLIRDCMGDNVGITTDIIVGYPTETQSNFEETLEFVNKMSFSAVHAFRYSPRPNTVSAKLPPLDSSAVDARLDRLLQLTKRHQEQFLQRQVGLTHQVCFDGDTKNGVLLGYSSNYCRVECKDAKPYSIKTAKAVGVNGDTLVCE